MSSDLCLLLTQVWLRNAGALEMEASAFLQVCQVTGVHAFGVIKGVSDLGDKHKGTGNDSHYRASIKKAADATKCFVEYKLEQIPTDYANIGRCPPGDNHDTQT
jgi:hypothetical protein